MKILLKMTNKRDKCLNSSQEPSPIPIQFVDTLTYETYDDDNDAFSHFLFTFETSASARSSLRQINFDNLSFRLGYRAKASVGELAKDI